jgi:cobalt-zinc-cadmium resistance protein CzcA
MIDRIVAFALHQRFVVVALALILTVGGLVSYGHLPIEAYPDVGDVKVEIITLWAGHAAEEVERLITIPLENELNGIANVTFLRSDTLFGLSNIRVLFADGTDDYWARQQVQGRLAAAEIPSDAKPQLGPLSGVIGEIFRYTLESKTMPLYEVKAIQDWVLEREFKKVPGVADVVSWGGGTKQYQVVVDPGRLRAYNLTLKQVFDAVTSNNSNAGSGYIAQGDYRIPVRGIGLVQSVADIESIVVAAQKGTPVRVRDIGSVAIGTAIRLGVLGRDHDDDLVQGIVLMRKGENPGQVIEGVKARAAQVQKLLPTGVELRPYYSRDRLVQTTVHTVLRNLIEGAALVVILLSLFLYNIRAALIVALTIPLSLLFAFIFMDLRGIPANLLSLGAIDFGIIVDGAVIMTENIVRRLAERPTARRPGGAGGAARGGGGGAPAHLCGVDHHDGVRADPHLPADRGQAVPPDGGDDLPRSDRGPRAHPDSSRCWRASSSAARPPSERARSSAGCGGRTSPRSAGASSGRRCRCWGRRSG